MDSVDLARVAYAPHQQEEEDFGVEEVPVSALPGWAGHSLADLEVPTRFRVTVLAVAGGLSAYSRGEPLE